MNERIRELAVQARQEFLKMPTGYTPEQVGMYPQLMEKFAELIVRECAKSLWTEECHTSDLAVEEYNRNSKKIRQHFGIES